MDSIKLIVATLIITCSFSCTEKGLNKGAITSNQFEWIHDTPESQGMLSSKLDTLVHTLSEKGTKKLLIIRNDKVVCEWFAPGFEDSVRLHYTASLAKAIVGGMSLATAMSDGYIFPDEPACNYIHSWKESGVKSKITIRHLATHTSGIENAEVSEKEQKEMQAKGLSKHMDLPGWKGHFWKQDINPFLLARDSAPVVFTPGSDYAYSNPGIGMLTYAVTASLGDSPYKDIRTYLKERIFNPIGIGEKEYVIGYNKTFELDGLNLVPSWGGGLFTANGIARIGRLMLNKGNWQGKQLIDSAIVEEVIRYNGKDLPNLGVSELSHLNIREQGFTPTLGWYCNHDGAWKYIPRDAFVGAGAQNQMLMVIPSLNMVVVRLGDALFDPGKGEGFFTGAEKYLFDPIMESLVEPPYPPSDLIKSVIFAPKDSVIRLAKGSDNWPATWADDGNLYTAYGDGWGFDPKVDIKLSLGIAKVIGNPPNVRGENIRSKTGEKVGQGRFGPKASGMLMVDRVLYMLTRNSGNAQLAWSEDYGKTWVWAGWHFGEGFGCPTFLNYGKNYEGAKDDFVYIYSHDEASAYKVSDQMVLARVHKSELKNWEAYTYFAGFQSGKPAWTEDVRKRQPVFVNPGKCYRSGVTYNKGLNRYLWCQIIPLSSGEELQGPRFKGGLGIFESATPWGPWKTAYYTMDWDMGPGETASIPAKWMSNDGKICYYLFSGNDCLSVRKMVFNISGLS
ncbi:Beta-lactamase class C-like and penicillin binding proteins (PBPs) superfamily [hydrothermal vent metagenome]|uniref:Beta-lactamase class C-like and penicillin binding proteins (PBPs) superfamily n=1 Tax=hydrothermal vent metagenome TaxID=652676 RepID=A0A3B0TYW0_9ZZZZ